MRHLQTGLIVYPGTFDPLTFGHFDLLQRASGIFERVILAIAADSKKTTAMFSCDDRLAMAREVAEGMGNVTVEKLDGMLVDFLRAHNARVVLRGLRAYSDFEYEFQMALMNRKLASEIETLFMMPKEEYSYVTSGAVREVARVGGDTSLFVPPAVEQRLAAIRNKSRQ